MNSATKLFDEMMENEISNTDLGYSLIDQHQKTKKGKKWFMNNKNNTKLGFNARII